MKGLREVQGGEKGGVRVACDGVWEAVGGAGRRDVACREGGGPAWERRRP